MKEILVTKTRLLPDKFRIARFRRTPELGPRILFFSGGTALKGLSRHLINFTHNSIHLITPFDSGGSSAKLRKAFSMPAIGDIRNRLMCLADQTVRGNPEIYRLFAYRLPKEASSAELESELERMCGGVHTLVGSIPEPLQLIIRHHLIKFKKEKPRDFDLRGASIGNLVLTAGYLEYDRHIDPVIFLYSKMVEVRGMVRPVVSKDYHLAVELSNGELIIGQHLITGKETRPIASGIKKIYLAANRDNPEEVRVGIKDKIKKLITEADLICYPMGSFFSSLVANLLPGGVGTAISQNGCPKIYVPNTGHDPETYGMTLMDQIKALLHYLQRDDNSIEPDSLINFILIDSQNGDYNGLPDAKWLADRGIKIIDMPIVSKNNAPMIDDEMLVRIILSLS